MVDDAIGEAPQARAFHACCKWGTVMFIHGV